MTNIYLFDNIVAFYPGRNLLISCADENHRLSLSNPATRCLLILIQHHGHVVERDYFYQHVWESNGAQVTNNAFYQNISLLRRAFKEFGLNEEWIVTVPKVGVKLESLLHIEVQEKADTECGEDEPVVALHVARRLPLKLIAIAVIIIACMVTAFVTWRSEFDLRFTTYVSLSEQGDCHYYGNADVLNHDKHQRVIQNTPLDCQNYPWSYITLYPNFSRVSVLMCRQKYSQWRENDCLTRYIFVEDRHVPA